MTVPTPMVFLLALLVLALGGWVAFLRGKLARGAAQSTADQREAAAAREHQAVLADQQRIDRETQTVPVTAAQQTT